MLEPAQRPVLFSTAVQHHLAGDLAAAEPLYRQLLEHQPDDAASRHYLGFLLQQRDQLDEAREQLTAAIALDGSHAEWHFNLGIVLVKQGEGEAAIAAFTRAIALDNRRYFYWTNLGAAFEAADEPQHAEQCYDMALRLDPECGDAYFLLASLYLKLARYPEARHYNYRGIAASAGAGTSRILLGQAYHELGRPQEAVQLFQQWLAEEPGHPVASHLLAAYQGGPVPERCSPAYVEATFDAFADSFDDILQRLDYAGPGLVADYLAAQPKGRRFSEALDLGCGTGQVGEAIRPYVDQLSGVDLSQAMLAQSRQRGVYDQLLRADIGDFLAALPARYALITCMDTFIYLGRLDVLLPRLHASLEPGGLLLFSTEKLEGQDVPPYWLNTSGRYSHAPQALAEQLQAAGLQLLIRQEVVLRKEAGCAIAGQFYAVTRPA
ncbi:tetratricopeptide repeat protein [Chitinimonas sp.]|uniref:tetratricopeptide repeat protein n=1 Tax=Chitinimonas sp. TaxID=1934313 RepID=UPI002F93AEB3